MISSSHPVTADRGVDLASDVPPGSLWLHPEIVTVKVDSAPGYAPAISI